MQPAQEIIVLAVGTREKRRRVLEENAFELLRALDRLERARIVDADAIDQQLVEFADLAPGHHWKGQQVPEREAEIIDQHFLSRLARPTLAEGFGEQPVDFAGAGIEIDGHRQPVHQAVDARCEASGDRLRVAGDVPDFVC